MLMAAWGGRLLTHGHPMHCALSLTLTPPINLTRTGSLNCHLAKAGGSPETHMVLSRQLSAAGNSLVWLAGPAASQCQSPTALLCRQTGSWAGPPRRYAPLP